MPTTGFNGTWVGGGGSGGNANPTMAQMQQAGFSVDMMNNGGYGIGADGKPYALGGGSPAASTASSMPTAGGGMGALPGATSPSTVTNSGTNYSFQSGPAGPFGNLTAPLQNAGQSVLNTAFDPQSALYNKTMLQTQDKARVAEAARGTTMSPYGASVEANAMSNANMDWQDRQLGRQTQGIQSAGNLYNMGGNSTRSFGTQPVTPQQPTIQQPTIQQQQGSAPQQQPQLTLPTFNMPSTQAPQNDYYGGAQAAYNTNYNGLTGWGGQVDNNMSGYGISTGTDPTVYNNQTANYTGGDVGSGYIDYSGSGGNYYPTANYTGGDVGSGYIDYSGSGGNYSPTLSSSYTPDPTLMGGDTSGGMTMDQLNQIIASMG